MFLSVPRFSSLVCYENHCFRQDILSYHPCHPHDQEFVKADKFSLLLHRYTFMEDGLLFRGCRIQSFTVVFEFGRLHNRRQLLHHNCSRNGQLLLHHNGKSRLWLFLLFLCGDVELNPGSVKSLCGYCVKGVHKNQCGIFCDSCLTWYHTSCLDMPKIPIYV